MTGADLAALSAVMTCTIAAIECARYAQQDQRDHRLFVSLILFGLNWAILLPYYALHSDNLTPGEKMSDVRNFLPAYSGVLILFAGGALRREAVSRGQVKGTGKYDFLALWCLYLLAIPHAISFVPAATGQRVHQLVVIVLQPLLTILGFFSFVAGLKTLTEGNESRWLWWIFLAISCLYAGADVWYRTILVRKTVMQAPYQMPDLFKWIFAACKVTFSFVFLVMVIRQTRRQRDKRQRNRATAA